MCHRVLQINCGHFTIRLTFKLFDKNLRKFSEVIFKLYSSTLFYIFVVGWINMAKLASRTAICELRRAGKNNWPAKDDCLSICNQVWCYGWIWKKSPQPTKGSKTNEKFPGRHQDVDKGGSKSVNVETSQKYNVSHRTISGAVNEDLEMKSNVKRPRNLLTARQWASYGVFSR